MNKYNFNMCMCSMQRDELDAAYYKARLIEECIEFISEPSMDEFSDCMLLLSLLVYTLTDVGLVLPCARRSLDKGRIRVELHGCVRSYRNRCSE